MFSLTYIYKPFVCFVVSIKQVYPSLSGIRITVAHRPVVMLMAGTNLEDEKKLYIKHIHKPAILIVEVRHARYFRAIPAKSGSR